MKSAEASDTVTLHALTGQPQTDSHGWGPEALIESRRARREHQARLAEDRQRWIDRNRHYYDGVRRVLKFVIEPGRRVLNVRCQTGHFLEAVAPCQGVGVEISEELVDIARRRYPQFTFLRADPEELQVAHTFD